MGKILHLDSDVLILTDILNVWNHFKEMDRHDPIAAMAPEHMPPGDGWYNTQAKIPYCGPRGMKGLTVLKCDNAALRIQVEFFLFPQVSTLESC